MENPARRRKLAGLRFGTHFGEIGLAGHRACRVTTLEVQPPRCGKACPIFGKFSPTFLTKVWNRNCKKFLKKENLWLACTPTTVRTARKFGTGCERARSAFSKMRRESVCAR